MEKSSAEMEISLGRSDLRGDEVKQTQVRKNTSERNEPWLIRISKSQGS